MPGPRSARCCSGSRTMKSTTGKTPSNTLQPLLAMLGCEHGRLSLVVALASQYDVPDWSDRRGQTRPCRASVDRDRIDHQSETHVVASLCCVLLEDQDVIPDSEEIYSRPAVYLPYTLCLLYMPHHLNIMSPPRRTGIGSAVTDSRGALNRIFMELLRQGPERAGSPG